VTTSASPTTPSGNRGPPVASNCGVFYYECRGFLAAPTTVGSREADEAYAYSVRKADTSLVEALDAFIAENRDTYGWPQ
jgi:hypothetical protein